VTGAAETSRLGRTCGLGAPSSPPDKQRDEALQTIGQLFRDQRVSTVDHPLMDDRAHAMRDQRDHITRRHIVEVTENLTHPASVIREPKSFAKAALTGWAQAPVSIGR
jgi:hypothetical protein